MDDAFLGISAPRARVSRSALARNIARALSADPRGAIDLRRDACGHGARIVADAAHSAGATAAIVDGGADPHGFDTGVRALPLEAVFGLDGRGEPAMTLVSPVLQTKALRAGEGVSYGYRFRAAQDTRVALVSGGYAQGVVRALGGGATTVSVRIRGRELPIVGRVAMDVCVVDVAGNEVVARDDAVFFGSEAPWLLPQWSRATGWTELELAAFCGLHAATEEVA